MTRENVFQHLTASLNQLKNFAEIFPRFPKGDVKLVKPDKKIVQPIQSYSAFSNLEVDQKALYPFLYKANA